ncbi:MAG TPA: hypothetical protein VMU72_01110 [Gaiellaceae bacterium]|nr:hypothetical protein [Gaiellaceae bacterium]
MPLQNRVTPLGELVATPERGLVYGNRGRLHDADGVIRRPWQVKRWISCRLEFRGRRRAGGPMAPNRYTGLFFLDEATAFAAGHRPCAECRREDYVRLMELVGEKRAEDIDARLHAERLGPKPERDVRSLPDGAFVLVEDDPWIVLGDELLRWTPGGYTERRVARGRAALLTPPTVLPVLESGWNGAVPFLHPSAA